MPVGVVGCLALGSPPYVLRQDLYLHPELFLQLASPASFFQGSPVSVLPRTYTPNWFFFCGLWGSNSGAMFVWQTLATQIARHVSVQMATDQEGNEENTFSCLKVNPTHLFLNANTLIAYCFRRWVCLCVRGREGTSVQGSISLWGFILSWSQNCPWLSQGQLLENYSHG